MAADYDRQEASPSERLIQEGLELYGRNHTAEAVVCWQRALAIDPHDERARDYLEAAGIKSQSASLRAKVIDLHQARPTLVDAAAARNKTAAGEVGREKLVKLIEERRYDEALAILYRLREETPGDTSISRSIRLVKDRLTVEYSRRVGHLDQVPRLRVDRNTIRGLQLTSDEQEILGLVDGIACYSDILEVSRLGRFYTYRYLADFLSQGLLESTPPPSSALPPPAPRPASTDTAAPRAPLAAPPAPAPAAKPNAAAAYDALFDRAMQAYLRRDVPEALRLFEECKTIRPDDPRVRHNLDKLRRR